MFLSCHRSKGTHSEDLWLLDSGCNNHMISNKNMFPYLDASMTSRITLGDCSCIKVEGKGTVSILTKCNQQKYINDFYYVPHMNHNFISVGQLMEHGYGVIFQGKTCFIYDKLPNIRLIENVEKTNNRMFL